MKKPAPSAKPGRPPKSKRPEKVHSKRGRPERVPLCEYPRRYDVATVMALSWMVRSARSGAWIDQWYEGDDPTKLPDAKAVDALRKLAASFVADPDDLAWLIPISEAVVISFAIGDAYPDLAIREVLKRTNHVKDRWIARHVLLPDLFAQRRKKRRPN